MKIKKILATGLSIIMIMSAIDVYADAVELTIIDDGVIEINEEVGSEVSQESYEKKLDEEALTMDIPEIKKDESSADVDIDTFNDSFQADNVISGSEDIFSDGVNENNIASGKCGDNINWILDSEGTLTLYGEGVTYDYSMHTKNMPWYSYNGEIVNIKVSEGITEIGEDIFSYSAVRNAQLPNSLKSIKSAAFYACGSLENIQLPDSLEYIGRGTFSGCGIQDINIPSTVTFIGDCAFSSCHNLKNIKVAQNMQYSDVNGVLYSADKTYLHTYPDGREGIYNIPDGTKEIGPSAFRYASEISELVLPSSVERINDYAFSFCSSLKNIDISKSVNYFGSGVFEGCSSLQNIKVDDNNVFYCDVEGVLFNSEKTTLIMFPSAKTEYNVPEGTEIIAGSAFSDSMITNIQLPDTLKTINWYAFDGCRNLSNITIPKNVEMISYHAFRYCTGLEHVKFECLNPDIDQNSFDECSNDLCLVGHEGSAVETYALQTQRKFMSIPHTWQTKYIIDRAAGCTENGQESIHCIICGKIEEGSEKEIPALGHSWNEGEITKEATCTEQGERKYTCIVCGESRVEGIEAGGHKEVVDEEVAPTCTESGKTEGSHCSVCGEILKEQKEIPALGHNWNEGEITKKASCTESGERKYTCTVCGESRVEGIEAGGHKEVVDEEVAPTCTESGKTEGSHCSVCGEILKEQKEIPALGHNWNEGEITKKASCTESGERKYTCTVCGESRVEGIEAGGHKEVVDEEVAPTCTESGKTEGSHCSVCGEILKEQKEIPALGHNWNEGEITKKASCTESGERKYTCTVCGESRVEGIEAGGHKEVVDEEVAPTCTESGKTEGSHCSVCGAILKGQKGIPAIGHKYTSWVTKTAATVFSPKVQEHKCISCSKKEMRKIGSKLKATIKTSVNSLILKTGQKTYALKVTGIATGDSIISWKSNNIKIVQISGKKNGYCTITAGRKKGKAIILITLKSGLKKSIPVTVQTSNVKTKSIMKLPRVLRLRRNQSFTLKPVLSPVTSQERITYQSQNIKIASVASTGKIKARREGTTIITIKSGSKYVKCKVIVSK